MRLTLETQRLILRPFRPEDAQAMFEGWASDPEVTKYLTWNAHRSIADTEAILRMWEAEYDKPERLNFAIVLKENRALIGGIDVVGYLGGADGIPVIGYNLSRAFWNRGYMSEACRRLLDYLFAKGYPAVRIDAMAENARSNRVIRKCGGVFQRAEEEYVEAKGKTVSVNRYLVYAPYDPDKHCDSVR